MNDKEKLVFILNQTNKQIIWHHWNETKFLHKHWFHVELNHQHIIQRTKTLYLNKQEKWFLREILSDKHWYTWNL